MQRRVLGRVGTGLAWTIALVALWGAVWVSVRSLSAYELRVRALAAENERLAERWEDAEARATAAGTAAGAANGAPDAQEADSGLSLRLRLALVRGALAADDPRAAEQALSSVPEGARGFAWSVYAARLAAVATPLDGHEGDVLCVARSADGRRFASASAAGETLVWTPPKVEWSAELFDTGEEVTAIALDATGVRLAMADVTGALVVWRVDDGEELGRYEGDSSGLVLAFAPDGDDLAVGFESGGVARWSYATGEAPRMFGEHDDDVLALAFDPTSGRLASGSDDGSVRVWPAASEAATPLPEASDWAELEGAVRALCFDTGGSRLLTGDEDGTVVLWDANTGAVLERLASAPAPILDVRLDGDRVAWVTEEGEATFTGLRESRHVRLSVRTPDFVDRDIAPFLSDAVIDPAAQRVLYTAGREAVRLWRGEPAAVVREWSLGSGDVASLAAGDRILVAGGFDGSLAGFDLATGARLGDVEAHGAAVLAVALSRGSDAWASASVDGDVRVHALASEPGDAAPNTEPRRFEAGGRVVSVALSSDGSRLLAARHDGGARLWNVAEDGAGELLRDSPESPGFVFSTAVAPDAAFFAWVADAGTVRVWAAATGERQAAWRDRVLGRVHGIGISANGTQLTCLSGGQRAHVFDLSTGAQLVRVERTDRSLSAFALDPSGATLALGALDGWIGVYDTHSGELALELAVPGEPRESGDPVSTGGPVRALTFGANGALLCAGTSAGRLFVWGMGEQP